MIELGLSRIASLLRQTPLSWTAIHVAGTNGKGSICAYLTAMLRANGIRCGRFTSPHLIDRWDCITINDDTVRESVFREVSELVEQRNKVEHLGASEFELLTATAFEIFQKEAIETGIVEVGLGGRLDATNVLHNKKVTVISKIGLDHQSFLGDTIQKIAREKAGIMRPGVPCVVDRSNVPEVHEVIETYAKEIGAEVVMSSLDPAIRANLSKKGYQEHQLDNLACAHTAFDLAFPGSQTLQQLLPAIESVAWPGRLQITNIKSITGRDADVLLDGAHNPQSAVALGTYVDRVLRRGGAPITYLLAASNGRELSDIMKPLLREGDSVISVQFGPVDGMPWVEAMSSEQILAAAESAAVAKSHLHDAGQSVRDGLQLASKIADGGPVVIAGSLYLVSDVLRLLRG